MKKAESNEEMFRDQIASLVTSHDTAYSLGYLESMAFAMFSRLSASSQIHFISQLEKTNSKHRIARARAHMVSAMQNEG